MPPFAPSKFKTEGEYSQCLLDALRDLEAAGEPVGDLLKRCAGVAWFRRDKLALVAGMDHGHGACIAQIRPRVWTAPVFLRTDQLSIGLQLTSTTYVTLLFLATQEAVSHMCRDHVQLGADASLPGGGMEAGVHSGEGQPTVLATYNLDDGGKFVDISLSGGMVTTDGGAMLQYFGTGVSIADVLAGNNAKAPHPVLFRPLYDFIDHHITEQEPSKQSVE